MNEKTLIISADEAISLLNDDGEYVHNFLNPSGGLMLGCDFERENAIEAFRKAHQIEIGGEGCKRMRHPIVVWDTPTRYSFFEADMTKVGAFEAARAAEQATP